MFIRKSVALVVATIITTNASAMTMQEVFDTINAEANVSNPAVLQGQTMNLYTGGSLFMRMPKRTYNLASVTPPSWSAGCGGIDLFMGGFSYINKEQFVAMLKNIGSNALGYGFKLAIQNLCPTCDNVMQALQASAQLINRQNIDSCQAAKGIVNATVSGSWERSKQEMAKGFGVSTSLFSDISDAWMKVMNDERKANKALDDAGSAEPTMKDAAPTGNVVWKALKKLDGIDDTQRMVLMSLVGSTIFDTSDPPKAPKKIVAKREITVEMLVGQKSSSDYIEIPIWKCDTTTADGCLNPTEDDKTVRVKSFKALVRGKMEKITDKISNRSDYGADLAETLAFLNATDLPIYKMLAVTTSLGNTAMADALIGRYQELIAAKYAEVYIQRAVLDLRNAISKFSATADASQAQELLSLKPELEEISRSARTVLSNAYSQTVSTYNIAQEVQYMERAMTSNLSATLRTSLAFGKSIR